MDKPLSCVVKAPSIVRFGDPKVEFNSGCAIMDVSFQNPSHVEIQEIHLKNYYTASLSLMVKRRTGMSAAEKDKQWKLCVQNLQLMPHPHADQGGEEHFTIGLKQLGGPLHNVTGLRFVLYQPSSVWKEFVIDDVKIFKNTSQASVDVSLPAWMQEAEKEESGDRQLKGVSSICHLSRELQNIWAHTLNTTHQQADSSLGRYDVDGSYEINLLSYT